MKTIDGVISFPEKIKVDPELVVGDVVHLKANAWPLMTVEGFDYNGAVVHVVFFDAGKLHREKLKLATIKRHEPTV